MLGVDGFWRPLAAAPLLRGTSRRPVKSTTPGTRRPPRQIKSPQAFRIGSFVSEKLRGVAHQLRDVSRCIVDLRMSHPPLKAGQEDAAADRVNEKAMPDALGRGMRSIAYARPGNDRRDLGKQCHSGLRPYPFIGAKTGAADAMRLVEKFNEGFRDGNGPRNLGGLKDNHPAGAVDLPGRDVERLREIAAGVMQDVATSPDRIRRAVRRPDEGAAFLLVEKEPRSLFVE
jgi:hypothetical protein